LSNQGSEFSVLFLYLVMLAQAGTYDKSAYCLIVAVGPGLRRDDESVGE
jgi:hypothetical protein